MLSFPLQSPIRHAKPATGPRHLSSRDPRTTAFRSETGRPGSQLERLFLADLRHSGAIADIWLGA